MTQNIVSWWTAWNVYAYVCLWLIMQQVQIVRDTSLITKEKLSAGLSIFSFWLQHLRQVLGKDPIWDTLTTRSGAWNVETNMEFHRIWSTMQFVFCLPAGHNPITLE